MNHTGAWPTLITFLTIMADAPELAAHMTCREAEALANLYESTGDQAGADAWRDAHAFGDEDDDDEHHDRWLAQAQWPPSADEQRTGTPEHWHSRALCQLSSPAYCAGIACRCYCHTLTA